MKEGEGTLHMVDGSYFKGHFWFSVYLLKRIFKKGNYHENQKHGKGESHMANGEVYIEEWEKNILINQIQQITIEDNIRSSQKIEKKSSKEKTEIKSIEMNSNPQVEETNEEDNKKEIEQIKEVSKEYEENLTSDARMNDDNDDKIRPKLFETEANMGDLEAHLSNNKYESNVEKDLLSEMKSELKTLDGGGGYDTLALIEQIEMFNSLNSCFLNKNSTFS